MARTAHRLLLLLAASLAHAQFAPAPGAVSVLIPLSFDNRCWSTATLRNLTDGPAQVAVEAHDSSGALLAFDSVPTSPLRLAPSDNVTIRLAATDSGDTMAWVKFTALNPSGAGPSVAISGLTNCSDGNMLTTIPAGVAYPTPSPWIEARPADTPGKMLLLLNTAPSPASARACYSSGTYTSVPDPGDSPDPHVTEQLICSSTRSIYLPPYALQLIPVEKDANAVLRVTTRGASLVLLVLKPRPGKTRRFTVDSTISFANPASN